VHPQWQATAAKGAAAPLSVLAAAEKLAAQGLRVLALARRSYEQLPGTGDELEAVESGCA
jgi:NAD(P)-dependent dehydrogenase (short-subunit alcohol dehydrogenase family)